jgi:hypothetical protein
MYTVSALLQESDNSIHSRSSRLSEQNQKNALVVAPGLFEHIWRGLGDITRGPREVFSILQSVCSHFVYTNTVAEKYRWCR